MTYTISSSSSPLFVMARPRGSMPTPSMVSTTWLFRALMTETLFDRALVMYTRSPFGVAATPYGSVPTWITLWTRTFLRLPVSLRADTVPWSVLATYASLPSGASATPPGSRPTGTSSMNRGVPRDVSKKLTESVSVFATASNSPSADSASGCDDVGAPKPACRAGRAD